MAQETASSILKDDVMNLRDEICTTDYSTQSEELVRKAETLKQNNGLSITHAIFEELLSLEKKCRQAQDAPSCARVCVCYMNCLVCVRDTSTQKLVDFSSEEEVVVDPFDAETMQNVDVQTPGFSVQFLGHKSVEFFCEQLQILFKKRAQLKRSVVGLTRMCMSLLKYLPVKDKLIILEALKKATEGKIFVEVERARLILIHALMLVKSKDLDQAATMLQDVQVETFGAMDRHEKTKYILKQMELLLARQDFIRCQIVSRKINPKLLDVDDMQELKVMYYSFLILYYLHDHAYLVAAKSFQEIYKCKHILEDQQKWMEAFECFVIFLVLAPHDAEAHALIKTTLKDETTKLQQLPVFERLLMELSHDELLSWPLPFESSIKGHFLFTDTKYSGGELRWTLFRRRILQHNLRVLSEHYQCIRLDRIASLLSITVTEAENELAELVCADSVKAKIDRPAQQVVFGSGKSNLDTLDEWAKSLGSLLENVDLCCHMIQKERLVHAARSKSAALLQRAAAN